MLGNDNGSIGKTHWNEIGMHSGRGGALVNSKLNKAFSRLFWRAWPVRGCCQAKQCVELGAMPNAGAQKHATN